MGLRKLSEASHKIMKITFCVQCKEAFEADIAPDLCPNGCPQAMRVWHKVDDFLKWLKKGYPEEYERVAAAIKDSEGGWPI